MTVETGRGFHVGSRLGLSESLALSDLLTPDLLDVLVSLIDQRVALALAASQAESGNGAQWLTLDQAGGCPARRGFSAAVPV